MRPSRTLRRPNRHLIAIATAVLAGAGSMAHAQEPTQKELLDKINGLQAQVDQLKVQLQSVSEQEKRATTRAVMQDAQARSQPFDINTISGSHQNGRFEFRTADGNFVVRPWMQFQLRDVTTYRQGGKDDGASDDWQNGFEIRRLKIGFEGNAISPLLTYNFNWATNRDDGTPQLEAAWVRYDFAKTPYFVRMGQLKDPLDHEQRTSTRYTASIDRTLIDDFFAKGEGFVQGVSLGYDNTNNVRSEVAFSDGLGSNNQNFQDFPTNNADWGTAGRFEYKQFGQWLDYDRLSMYGVRESYLVGGVGADYTEAGSTGYLTHVADMQYGGKSGFGIFASYLGRFGKGVDTGTPTDTYDWSLRGQLAYSIDRHWEPYLQLEYIDFDPASLSVGVENNNEVPIVRVGTNYYVHGDAARFQVDLSYLPNGSPITDTSLGVLQNNGENEFVFRAQFQLLL